MLQALRLTLTRSCWMLFPSCLQKRSGFKSSWLPLFFHLSLCNQATSISWYLYFQLDYFSIFFDEVFLSWLTEGQIQWFAGTDTAIFQLRYLNQFLRLAFQILKCFTNSIVAICIYYYLNFFRNFWTSFSIDYWRVKLTSFDIGYRFSDEIEQISITISLPIF